MQHKKEKLIWWRTLVLVAGLLLLNTGLKAQSVSSARAQAAIISPDDISSMELSSVNGTLFTLGNGTNRCFDLSVDGLNPILDSKNGSQKVNYELTIEQKEISSVTNTSIRLNVLFSQMAENGHYFGSGPYTISVHYN